MQYIPFSRVWWLSTNIMTTRLILEAFHVQGQNGRTQLEKVITNVFQSFFRNGCKKCDKTFCHCHFPLPRIIIGTFTNLTSGVSILSANGKQSRKGKWQSAICTMANRGKCRDVAKSFLRPVRKPFSFSVQSCFCQICYQMNPHMTRLSFWLMFISTLFLYFTRFTCGWHSACTCRTDLHFSKATQHLSSYTSPCSWWTRLTRFWSQHLPHFRCFCRTRWLLPPTCSWRSTGETIGWGHQTTCLRSTGHLDFHIWVGTRPGVSQMFAVIN